MAPVTTTVAIAGITGKLAQLITKYLLQSPDVHINGICRDPSKLPESIAKHPRITTFQATSTDTAALRKGLKGVFIVICCYLGSDDLMIAGQKTLIDASIAEKVPRYMASDWSIDYRRVNLGEIPSKDPMKHVQAYLDEHKDQIKGVHVLNGCFLEVPWRSIWDPKEKQFFYWGSGDERWELTTYGNAAEYTAKVAIDESAVGYKCFRGDYISVKSIAAVYKDVYGETPGLKHMGSLDDLYKKMHAAKAANPNNIWAYMGMFYTYYCSENPLAEMPKPLDNDKYPGVKLTTVRDYLEKFPADTLGQMLGYEETGF